MIELLKELEDNTSVNGIWHLCIASDESGELLISEDSIVIFDDKEELKTYVDALMWYEGCLTLAMCAEILNEVRK